MAAIYKRGGVWWGRAQRKGVEYRRSFETGDRRDAEKRLQTWLSELEASSWGGRARITFANAARRFVMEYLPTLKPSSARRYGVSLKWLSDKFGASMLDEIGREELAGFEGWRRALGTSSPTIRRDLACLSSIFSFCEDMDLIDDNRNPVPGFLRRRAKRGLRESPGRRRYLSAQEEQALIAAASRHVRDMICLAIDTGLRREELLSLKWPQIDFRRGIIQTTTDTKNGRSRSVPLPPRSAQLLAQRRQTEMASFFVFARHNGQRYASIDKGLDGAVGRAGIDAAGWHDLRRTAGCRWLQRDKRRMEEVSLMLGHSSVAVTEKSYAFLDEEAVAEEVAAQKPAHG